MAWTAPYDWSVGEVVTAAKLNEQLRHNMRYLKGLDVGVEIEDDLTVPNLITPGNVDGVDVSAHDIAATGVHGAGGNTILYSDHSANTTTAHGAVSAATASKIVVRDASARAKFAAAAAAGDAIVADANVRAPDSTLLEGSSKATVQDHTPKAHTIASHSDTTGTGAELDELTDGSETTLHSHAAALTVAETEVFSGTLPTTWSDLDLSGTIGANAALVLLKFSRPAGTTFTVRKDDDSDEFYFAANYTYAGGCATGRGDTNDHLVLLVATDASGVIEWIADSAAGTTTVDIIAYIK